MEQYNEAVKALEDEELRKKYEREERHNNLEFAAGNRHERRKAAALARKAKKRHEI